jgi:hypothetical protein
METRRGDVNGRSDQARVGMRELEVRLHGGDEVALCDFRKGRCVNLLALADGVLRVRWPIGMLIDDLVPRRSARSCGAATATPPHRVQPSA